MSDADPLRPQERGLLHVIACITSRVVSRAVSGEMTYVANRRSARDKCGG